MVCTIAGRLHGIGLSLPAASPRVRTRTASVMIKEDNKNGSMANDFGFSTDLTSLGFKNNVDNEVRIQDLPSGWRKRQNACTWMSAIPSSHDSVKSNYTASRLCCSRSPKPKTARHSPCRQHRSTKRSTALLDFVVTNEQGKEQKIAEQVKATLKDTIANSCRQGGCQPEFLLY